MRDLDDRLRNHVDTAAPPIDVAALARRLADEERGRAVPTTLTRPHRIPTPPRRRLRAGLAFVAGLVVAGATVGGALLLIGNGEDAVVETPPVTTTAFTEPSTNAPPQTTTTTDAPATTTHNAANAGLTPIRYDFDSCSNAQTQVVLTAVV